MHEIIFRGKRTDNGEWMEGFLIKHPSAVQIGNCSPWYISVPPRDPDDIGGWYNINPETVGQYTGLTDKYGTKIFEGDIIKIPCYRNDYGVVGYEVPECQYRYAMQGDGDWVDLAEWGSEVEVIGNIHDNPELLGGADK